MVTARTMTSGTRPGTRKILNSTTRIITCLKQDLKSHQNQHSVEIKLIWKEAERLWLERVASGDNIKVLERDVENL